MKLSSRSVLIEALKTVIDVSKCGSANQMADVCQKIGGATRRTVYESSIMMPMIADGSYGAVSCTRIAV